MKLIIGVSEDYYERLKDKRYNRKATTSDATILDGTPYEESPTGHWIFDEYMRKEDKKYAPNGFYLCSVCCNKQFESSNYCPNCGADMRGGMK